MSSYLSYESRICLWLYNIWYLIFQITYLRVLSSYVSFAIMYVSSFLPYRFIFIGEMSRSKSWHFYNLWSRLTYTRKIDSNYTVPVDLNSVLLFMFIYFSHDLLIFISYKSFYFVYELLCPSFCWYIYYFQSKGFILSFSLSVLWVFFSTLAFSF